MIVHVHCRCDVHGRDETQAVFHAAALNNLLHLICDVDHLAALFGFEYEVLGVDLHNFLHPDSQSRDRFFTAAFILVIAVTETNEHAAELLSQQGLDLLATDMPFEAAGAFRAAIAANPEYFEAHHGLIRALRDAGRLEQSIAAALALTALTPKDPLAHTALSISLQCAGHIPEAEAAAAKARILEWKIQLQSPPQRHPEL
jgi:tetratricopeptide (TPR) repeat protein